MLLSLNTVRTSTDYYFSFGTLFTNAGTPINPKWPELAGNWTRRPKHYQRLQKTSLRVEKTAKVKYKTCKKHLLNFVYVYCGSWPNNKNWTRHTFFKSNLYIILCIKVWIVILYDTTSILWVIKNHWFGLKSKNVRSCQPTNILRHLSK